MTSELNMYAACIILVITIAAVVIAINNNWHEHAMALALKGMEKLQMLTK